MAEPAVILLSQAEKEFVLNILQGTKEFMLSPEVRSVPTPLRHSERRVRETFDEVITKFKESN